MGRVYIVIIKLSLELLLISDTNKIYVLIDFLYFLIILYLDYVVLEIVNYTNR